MSKLLQDLKQDRLTSIKTGNKVNRYALEAVITEADTQRGRGIEITDSVVIDLVKKEIKKYKEMQGRQVEIDLLTTYLPRQLTQEELQSIYDDSYDIIPRNDIKEFLRLLDNKLGYQGCYDKRIAVEIVKKV